MAKLNVLQLVTMRIRACFDGVKEFHVTDVVDIDLIFQNHNKALAVEFDG